MKKFKKGDIVYDSYGQWKVVDATEYTIFVLPIGNFSHPYSGNSKGYPFTNNDTTFKFIINNCKTYLPNWL